MIPSRLVLLLGGTGLLSVAGCVVDDDAARIGSDTTVVAVPVGVPVTDTVTVTDTVRDTVNTVTPLPYPVPVPVPVDTTAGQRKGARTDTGRARADTTP